jgi:hypothetical protein
MFVRYFVEIAAPFQEVEAALLRGPETWIPGLARDAGDRGEDLLVEVGFGSPAYRVQREVEISIGAPMRFPSKTVLPISWKPISGGRLLPALDADVEVGPLGPNMTQLAISARYQPPLGAIGQAIDRALLHRVAEATVKDFLDRAALNLPSLPTAV